MSEGCSRTSREAVAVVVDDEDVVVRVVGLGVTWNGSNAEGSYLDLDAADAAEGVVVIGEEKALGAGRDLVLGVENDPRLKNIDKR